MSIPGILHEQLWRDVYVAVLQGLSANPQLTSKSYSELAEMAYTQATVAVKVYQT